MSADIVDPSHIQHNRELAGIWREFGDPQRMAAEITRLRGLADEAQGLNATLSIALDEITKQRDSLRAEVEALRPSNPEPLRILAKRTGWLTTMREWQAREEIDPWMWAILRRDLIRLISWIEAASKPPADAPPTTDAPGLGLGERGV